MAKTASKSRHAYVCSECGADHAKWQGQCDACGAWNTLAEMALETAAQAKSPASRRSGWAGKVDAPKVTPLADVRVDAQARASTGIGEFDRVLGGGLAEGAVVLVGGEPATAQPTGRFALVIGAALQDASDLLAFEIALEAGRPGVAMCSYNKINGTYGCENGYLMNQVLKQEWKFPGFVMSDWGGVHSGSKAARTSAKSITQPLSAPTWAAAAATRRRCSRRRATRRRPSSWHGRSSRCRRWPLRRPGCSRSGRRRGRSNADEITIFDSSGTGIQDVAAAARAFGEGAIELHAKGIGAKDERLTAVGHPDLTTCIDRMRQQPAPLHSRPSADAPGAESAPAGADGSRRKPGLMP